MKASTPAEPLRGEAAFRAHKAEIAKRNDSARAAAATRRATEEARVSERKLVDARRERSNLPHQPHP